MVNNVSTIIPHPLTHIYKNTLSVDPETHLENYPLNKFYFFFTNLANTYNEGTVNVRHDTIFNLPYNGTSECL